MKEVSLSFDDALLAKDVEAVTQAWEADQRPSHLLLSILFCTNGPLAKTDTPPSKQYDEVQTSTDEYCQVIWTALRKQCNLSDLFREIESVSQACDHQAYQAYQTTAKDTQAVIKFGRDDCRAAYEDFLVYTGHEGILPIKDDICHPALMYRGRVLAMGTTNILQKVGEVVRGSSEPESCGLWGDDADTDDWGSSVVSSDEEWDRLEGRAMTCDEVEKSFLRNMRNRILPDDVASHGCG